MTGGARIELGLTSTEQENSVKFYGVRLALPLQKSACYSSQIYCGPKTQKKLI